MNIENVKIIKQNLKKDVTQETKHARSECQQLENSHTNKRSNTVRNQSQ